MADFWDEGREDELVLLWRSMPCLYDISDRSYSDRTRRHKSLGEIATQLRSSGKYRVASCVSVFPLDAGQSSRRRRRLIFDTDSFDFCLPLLANSKRALPLFTLTVAYVRSRFCRVPVSCVRT